MKINKEAGIIDFETPGLGVTTLYLPPQLLREGATAEDRQVGNYYISLVDEIEQGRRKTLVLPQVFDEMGNKMFELVQPSITISFPSITHIEAVGDVIVASNKQSTKEEN